jgi:hypothetical protein
MLWRDIVVVVVKTRKKKKKRKRKKEKKGAINFDKIIVGTFVLILHALPPLGCSGGKNEPHKFPLNCEHTFVFFLLF